MMERDKNHPSVIIWSMGNECGNSPVFYEIYKWLKQRDNTRPVQFEQAGENPNTDIVCPMYPSAGKRESYRCTLADVDEQRRFGTENKRHATVKRKGSA
jgi:beta-galactosidase